MILERKWKINEHEIIAYKTGEGLRQEFIWHLDGEYSDCCNTLTAVSWMCELDRIEREEAKDDY